MSFYLFQSNRLGFRNWLESDQDSFYQLNSHPEVMRFFPSTLSKEKSDDFLFGLSDHFEAKGYTYFAVDLLETSEWIGFIGLKDQYFHSPFTPATDLGWRIKPEFWGNGYATEGAKACIHFAKSKLDLSKVIAVCPEINLASQKVMEKATMNRKGTFIHPNLDSFSPLNPCVCYEKELTHV